MVDGNRCETHVPRGKCVGTHGRSDDCHRATFPLHARFEIAWVVRNVAVNVVRTHYGINVAHGNYHMLLASSIHKRKKHYSFVGSCPVSTVFSSCTVHTKRTTHIPKVVAEQVVRNLVRNMVSLNWYCSSCNSANGWRRGSS